MTRKGFHHRKHFYFQPDRTEKKRTENSYNFSCDFNSEDGACTASFAHYKLEWFQKSSWKSSHASLFTEVPFTGQSQVKKKRLQQPSYSYIPDVYLQRNGLRKCVIYTWQNFIQSHRIKGDGLHEIWMNQRFHSN